MTATLHRFRPLLIGLIALLFTAGIALAARPDGPAPGRAIASEHAGKAVPVQAEEDAQGDVDEEVAEEEPVAEEPVEAVPVEGSGGENCATDPTGLTDEQLAEVRHGSVVCWAAHQVTPDGYANHGAWVSEWAKKNHGHLPSAADGAGTVLPAGASNKAHGKSRNH